MKLSFSISDDIARRLEVCARRSASGNASLVADVALKRFLDLPQADLDRFVSRHRMDRKASTRAGWAEAFWGVLGEEMGRVDMIDNPHTARNYGPFYAVLLMNRVGHQDAEDDPFPIHLGAQNWTPESPSPQGWTFGRTDSPVKAAETVARALKDSGVQQGT